jgi:PAS domain-containing protein
VKSEEFAARLAAVGEALLVPTAVLSADTGAVLYGNRELSDLLGLDSAVGPAASEFFQEAGDFEQLLREVALDGQLRETDLGLVTADGGVRKVQVSLRRVGGLSDPGAVTMTLRDVTDQRRRAAELSELARFPDMNPGPVLRFDQTGHIALANAAALAAFGAEELVGRSWLDVCSGMDERRWQNLLREETASIEESIGSRSFVVAHVVDSETGAVFAFGSEVTSIREADRLIDEQSEQLADFAKLPDMNPGPVFKLEPDTTILLANLAALELFGTDLDGQKWADICPDFESADWDEVLRSEEFVAVERPI